MTAVGTFGRLTSTVVPRKGEGFNEPFDFPVDPVGVTTVFSLENLQATRKMYLTGLYFSFPDECKLVLKKEGDVIWRGRVGAVVPDINPIFPDSEDCPGFSLEPGEAWTLEVEQGSKLQKTAYGNLFGYMR